jgi:hypothetical protein
MVLDIQNTSNVTSRRAWHSREARTMRPDNTVRSSNAATCNDWQRAAVDTLNAAIAARIAEFLPVSARCSPAATKSLVQRVTRPASHCLPQ